MALNANERELLAVVKYYNSQRRNVRKLVAKLYADSDLNTTSDLTGFTHDEIVNILEAAKPKPQKSKQIDIDQQASASTWIETPDAREGYRLAIHINAHSDLFSRTAYEVAKAIETEMRPGDKVWSKKEMMERWEIGTKTTTAVYGILSDHNWIEPAESDNFRKGYVVK